MRNSTLLALNCLLLAVGIGGGPLVMRLYFIHGGKRIWLEAWLESAGFPVNIVPLVAAYIHRHRQSINSSTPAKLFFITKPLFLAATLIGFLAGAADYLYAYGVKHIPVSTSSLILATQLAFTAVFAYVLVRQRFTAYAVNGVVLLTLGAAVLAMHTNSDRPDNVTKGQYLMGFFMTLASAAMFAALLPLMELTYKTAKMEIHYALVMEIQSVLSLSATILCTVGMAVNNDFKAMQREAKDFELGEGMYCFVLVCSALVWQCFYLGAAGTIHYGSSLLSGIIIAMALPVTEVLAVIIYHEKFQQEKAVSLALSLWGFVSYFYGESKQSERSNEDQTIDHIP
ncbi:hypothetical protein Droror1_Dr00011294 [Drosera rotundifolia]